MLVLVDEASLTSGNNVLEFIPFWMNSTKKKVVYFFGRQQALHVLRNGHTACVFLPAVVSYIHVAKYRHRFYYWGHSLPPHHCWTKNRQNVCSNPFFF